MSILLDTHYVYALAGAPGRLSKAEIQFLADHDQPFGISAVSVWEMRLKWSALYKSGRSKGPVSAAHALQALAQQPIAWLPLSAAHAAAALTTPLAHKDPFDELLLVQAESEGLRLLTRDSKLQSHPLVICV